MLLAREWRAALETASRAIFDQLPFDLFRRLTWAPAYDEVELHARGALCCLSCGAERRDEVVALGAQVRHRLPELADVSFDLPAQPRQGFASIARMLLDVTRQHLALDRDAHQTLEQGVVDLRLNRTRSPRTMLNCWRTWARRRRQMPHPASATSPAHASGNHRVW